MSEGVLVQRTLHGESLAVRTCGLLHDVCDEQSGASGADAVLPVAAKQTRGLCSGTLISDSFLSRRKLFRWALLLYLISLDSKHSGKRYERDETAHTS